MIKLLIGGSPCTSWSVAQSKNRETKPEGIGWELFRNFVIAKEKFKPDFFLYENNKSASLAIKEQIAKELNVWTDFDTRMTEINSALVSAQKRERFYVTNFGNILQPEDRGILLRDILERDIDGTAIKNGVIYQTPRGYNNNAAGGGDGVKENKAPALTANGSWQENNPVIQPIRVGCMPNEYGEISNSQGQRIYSIDGKSVCLSANGGGGGAKTGLYAIPTEETAYPVLTAYLVRGGKITIRDKQYDIKLPDGYYVIRKLTVTECCRLQTMPDDYCKAVSATRGYQGLGNGWTAEVIIHLLDHVLRSAPKDEKILVLSMYDGIGTGRYCLDKMGFTNVEYHAYEIDKYAMTVANDNYPDIIQHGDANAIRDGDAVREDDWRIHDEDRTNSVRFA